MSTINRPRRSALHLPASNPKAITKARTLPAEWGAADLAAISVSKADAVLVPKISSCNEVFSPGEEDLRWARAVIEAFAMPENAGKSAIRVEGRMAELLHLEQAMRLVAVAAQIAASA